MHVGSQHGEDAWVKRNVALPARGFFVEVGAAEGLDGSNTVAFDREGWSGLLIEPDPRNRKSLPANRPKCAVEFCAIGPADMPPRKFRLAPNPHHSGFGRTEGTAIDVPTMTLTQALEKHGVGTLDLLSIDTEGTEIEVWRSLDLSRWRPSVVFAEWFTLGLPDVSRALAEAVIADGYRLVHRTAVNFIFVSRETTLR